MAEANGIALINRARAALAKARTLPEIKGIRDQAEAARQLCKTAKFGLAAQNEAASVKIEAERRAGAMLAGMEKKANRHSSACTLQELGIEATQSHRWQLLASLPDKTIAEHSEFCLTNDRELTSGALLKLAKKHRAVSGSTSEVSDAEEGVYSSLETIDETGVKFRTVYADPPWQYSNQATRASTDNHYPTMTPEEIAALPVAELVDDGALLFLWTTNGFLFESKLVIDAWGFEFKSSMVWVKPQIGIGNYVRNSHEFLLIASRGGMRTTEAGKSQVSWIQADRGKHSAKPQVFRKAVEELGEPNRLELFGRSKADGWVVFGNQIGKTLL